MYCVGQGGGKAGPVGREGERAETGSSMGEEQKQTVHGRSHGRGGGKGRRGCSVLSSTLNPHFPHLNPCRSQVAVLGNMAYLFGGIVEIGEQEITLDDMWRLDLVKMDG